MHEHDEQNKSRPQSTVEFKENTPIIINTKYCTDCDYILFVQPKLLLVASNTPTIITEQNP